MKCNNLERLTSGKGLLRRLFRKALKFAHMVSSVPKLASCVSRISSKCVIKIGANVRGLKTGRL